MSSGLSKVTAERHARMLQELTQLPGNGVCADCKAHNPRWSSWNLGIFLCVQCASVHRKIGTHVTKVKSLTLDSWTREQVESVKNMGNLKSNAYYNPDERRHPPPTNMEDSERDSELEKFIRAKYEYKRFMAKDAPASKPSSNGALPPPPSRQQDRAKSTPLPAIIASKASPPPPPIEEETKPVFPATLPYRPASSVAQIRPPVANPPSLVPVQLPAQYTPQPTTPSALSPTSPVYGEMVALQTGAPLPQSAPQRLSYASPIQQTPIAGNPFHALQQQPSYSGSPSFPSSLSHLAASPSRTVSLPVSSPSAISPPTLSVHTPGGVNPFFQQQQQQQQSYLQPNPTGFQSAFPTANAMPINIPTSQPFLRTGPFLQPSQSPSSPFIQPSPTGIGQHYFSPTATGTSPFAPSPFQQSPPFLPSRQSPFSSSPFSHHSISPSPTSPFQQQPTGYGTSNSPFAQPQQQQQPQQQDHLATFASNMLPQPQRQPGTNPFGTGWQSQYGAQQGGWGGT